jgi:hypothetical protein
VHKEVLRYTASLSTLLKTTRSHKLRELLNGMQADHGPDTSRGRLYRELFACFPNTECIELDIGKLRSEVAFPGTSLKTMADHLLNCGYSSRYWEHPETFVDIAHHVLDSSPTGATVVAIQDMGSCSIVLGTFRVAWENLEVFQLFQPLEGKCWPHQRMAQQFGEAGRLGMHPLLDLLSSSTIPEASSYGNHYKVQAFRKAMEPAMALLQEKRIKFFYYIASPTVQKFLERAGPPSTRAEGVVSRMSSTAQAWREQLHLYFKPSEVPENQPQVYYSPVLLPSAW